MQKMRIEFGLDDDEMKKCGRRMPNKNARGFYTRGIYFLGRINSIANLLDELRREGSSELERAKKAKEDLEEIWIWADKLLQLSLSSLLHPHPQGERLHCSASYRL
jgi:hypothetical protein